jgi:enterochelin esterase-like enzyme
MPSGTRLWLDGLGDWSWPGRAAAAELMPPAWVPARPPRLEPALASATSTGWGAQERIPAWRLGLATLAAALLAVFAAVALSGPAARDRLAALIGLGGQASAVVEPTAVAAAPAMKLPLPPLELVRRGTTGGAVEQASFYSRSLHGMGSFYVYVPHGYAGGTSRYPVLYLLHGRNGHAKGFLGIGIVAKLDHLIATGRIPPMIVVMVQDRPGLNNWRDLGARHSATYVVEVQELADRMLRTIPTRSARAIAGSSMGGFGAMNVALANPLRFAVVESWLGYFNHLEGELEADRPVIRRLGLHAFLYGASEDPVAVPQEDPEFAAELRAAGAQAEGVIYPGGHSLEKVQAHLDTGLAFAGRSLREAQQRANLEARHATTG